MKLANLFDIIIERLSICATQRGFQVSYINHRLNYPLNVSILKLRSCLRVLDDFDLSENQEKNNKTLLAALKVIAFSCSAIT